MFIERDGTKIELTENECRMAFEEFLNNILKKQAEQALLDHLYIDIEEGTYVGGSLNEDFIEEYGCAFNEMMDEKSEYYILDDMVEKFKEENDSYNHFSYDDEGWLRVCESIIG